MIERAPVAGYSVNCDFCSHEEEFDQEEFAHVVAEMKENGWKITKIDGEWTHRCPGCPNS